MENLVLNIFCSMTLFKKMLNYEDISKTLILGTFTSSSIFSNSSNLRGVRFLICYFIVGPLVFGRVGEGSKGVSKMVLEYIHGTAGRGQKTSSTAMDNSVARFWN